MTAEQQAREHARSTGQLSSHSAVYCAVSAPAALVGGLLSLALSAVMLRWQAAGPGRNVDAREFFTVWTMVFLLTLLANVFFIWRAAVRSGDASATPGLKLAARSATPALFAGAAISGCLTLTTELPVFAVLFWLVFYGLALLSMQHFAPRSLVTLGWAFLITGAGAFIYFMNQTLLPGIELPTPTRFYPAAIMGATFGLYHVVYAVCGWPRRSDAS